MSLVPRGLLPACRGQRTESSSTESTTSKSKTKALLAPAERLRARPDSPWPSMVARGRRRGGRLRALDDCTLYVDPGLNAVAEVRAEPGASPAAGRGQSALRASSSMHNLSECGRMSRFDPLPDVQGSTARRRANSLDSAVLEKLRGFDPAFDEAPSLNPRRKLEPIRGGGSKLRNHVCAASWQHNTAA